MTAYSFWFFDWQYIHFKFYILKCLFANVRAWLKHGRVKREPRGKKVSLWNDRQSGAEKEELGTWPLGVSQPSPVIFCWDSSLTFKAALWQNSRTNKGLHFWIESERIIHLIYGLTIWNHMIVAVSKNRTSPTKYSNSHWHFNRRKDLLQHSKHEAWEVNFRGGAVHGKKKRKHWSAS